MGKGDYREEAWKSNDSFVLANIQDDPLYQRARQLANVIVLSSPQHDSLNRLKAAFQLDDFELVSKTLAHYDYSEPDSALMLEICGRYGWKKMHSSIVSLASGCSLNYTIPFLEYFQYGSSNDQEREAVLTAFLDKVIEQVKKPPTNSDYYPSSADILKRCQKNALSSFITAFAVYLDNLGVKSKQNALIDRLRQVGNVKSVLVPAARKLQKCEGPVSRALVVQCIEYYKRIASHISKVLIKLSCSCKACQILQNFLLGKEQVQNYKM